MGIIALSLLYFFKVRKQQYQISQLEKTLAWEKIKDNRHDSHYREGFVSVNLNDNNDSDPGGYYKIMRNK